MHICRFLPLPSCRLLFGQSCSLSCGDLLFMEQSSAIDCPRSVDGYKRSMSGPEIMGNSKLSPCGLIFPTYGLLAKMVHFLNPTKHLRRVQREAPLSTNECPATHCYGNSLTGTPVKKRTLARTIPLFHLICVQWNHCGTGGGEISRREYFAVGNFVFQMCAKFPAQFSGHCAK